MHHTTLTLLRTLADLDRSGALSDCYLVRHNEDAPLDLAVHAWSEADYPDADPGTEARNARTLEDLAALAGPKETGALAGPAALDHAAATTPEAYRGVVADAVAEELEQLRAKAEASLAIRTKLPCLALADLARRIVAERDAAKTEREAARAEAGRYHIHLGDIAAALGIKQPQLDTLAREVAQVMEDRDVARTNTEKVRGRLYAAESECALLAQRLGEREAELRIAREEAARPRLRDRVWRWVGVGR